MDDHRRHHHLTADHPTALAYARMADRHDAARTRRDPDPDDPRVHDSPRPLIRAVRRPAAWWRRGRTGAIAARATRRADKAGARAGSDLPSLLRC